MPTLPTLAKTRPARRNETRDLVRPIRIALNKLPGVRVARNNNGSLRWGVGQMLKYGLGEGSADLVGIVTVPTRWVSVEDPPPIGRAFCLEVKWPGEKPTRHQSAWLAAVRKLGGFATVVHSVEEAIQAVDRCRRGESE